MLTVRFGGLAALSQVNFEVQRGEIRAIIGPNGAGKSTFFNCLTGVLRPTAGRIVFGAEDITGRQCARLHPLSQLHSLFVGYIPSQLWSIII